MNISKHYIDNAIATFKSYQRLGEKAIQQLSNEELHMTPSSESNSIAIIVKHLHGNMKSR